MIRVAAIGECMVELYEEAPGLMRRTFGGDTLNTAVYLARSLRSHDARVDYVTALGDDPFSEELAAAWAAEGVGVGEVRRLPGRLPGLYIIRTDARGERSFHYWRSAAAARDLFRVRPVADLAASLDGCALVYASGVTLGIFDDDGRAALIALLARLRAGGTRIAFDTNYRPRLWRDADETRRWVERALAVADLALPTFDDEQALHGDPAPEDTVRRIAGHGVAEIAVKLGREGCLVGIGGERLRVPAAKVERVVDSTAAGDSFNAAYMAARLIRQDPAAAAAAGHALAARVIQFKGAIIPA